MNASDPTPAVLTENGDECKISIGAETSKRFEELRKSLDISNDRLVTRMLDAYHSHHQEINNLSCPPLVPDEGTYFDRTLKEKAVKIMNDCLWFWQTYTGKTKIQLAQESEIWTVSFDRQKGTEKAQTMEKYLKIKTFPVKRPKIDAIVKTVLFVLDQKEIPFDKKEDLKALFDEFSYIKSIT